MRSECLLSTGVPAPVWRPLQLSVSGIRFMPAAMDIVIIATGADVRRKVIEELLEQAHVSYLLLEKVLFQRLEDYDVVASLLERKQAKAFVTKPANLSLGSLGPTHWKERTDSHKVL